MNLLRTALIKIALLEQRMAEIYSKSLLNSIELQQLKRSISVERPQDQKGSTKKNDSVAKKEAEAALRRKASERMERDLSKAEEEAKKQVKSREEAPDKEINDAKAKSFIQSSSAAVAAALDDQDLLDDDDDLEFLEYESTAGSWTYSQPKLLSLDSDESDAEEDGDS